MRRHRITCSDRMCGALDCVNCHTGYRDEPDEPMNEDNTYQAELRDFQEALAHHIDGASRIIRALGLGPMATPPEVLTAISMLKTKAEQWNHLAKLLAKDLAVLQEVFPTEQSRQDMMEFDALENAASMQEEAK